MGLALIPVPTGVNLGSARHPGTTRRRKMVDRRDAPGAGGPVGLSVWTRAECWAERHRQVRAGTGSADHRHGDPAALLSPAWPWPAGLHSAPQYPGWSITRMASRLAADKNLARAPAR